MTNKSNLGPKYDSDKTDLSFLEYFPLALEAVCKICAFGGQKGYSRGSFKHVPDARKRYTAAMLRHYFSEGPVADTPNIDPESGYPHDYAVAWNALCRLELRLQKEQTNGNECISNEGKNNGDISRKV